ncbi:MAG: hypothetical protein ACYDHH_21735 [Solirubrobacteraceae bacterium]
MNLGTGAIVFAVIVGLYAVVLFFESQRRNNRSINDHPWGSSYDPARGAARQGSGDKTEHTTSRDYARGTR